MNCAKCNNPLDTYFKVERVGRDGKPTTTVNVCSLACLVQWAYDYATTAGVKLVMAAHGAVQTTKSVVGGLLKAIKG